MKRIQTLQTRDLAKSLKTGGCGECQTSCQSACKTSCGLANQQCENANRSFANGRKRPLDSRIGGPFFISE